MKKCWMQNLNYSNSGVTSGIMHLKMKFTDTRVILSVKDQCKMCGFIYKRSYMAKVTKGDMRHFKCMTCFKKFGSAASHRKHMNNNKHRVSAKIHSICDYLRLVTLLL